MRRLLIIITQRARRRRRWQLGAGPRPPVRRDRRAGGGAGEAAALAGEHQVEGRWNIAVKCDTPPFGYIGARSQNAGFDVEIARWFAKFAFGKANRVTLSCVTTPAREPALTTDRVDLVIATFTYNTDRETRIDFSRAYYKATGRLLVEKRRPLQALGTWPARRSRPPADPSTTAG